MTPKTYTRKIGANRGKPRLWLEGPILSESDWKHGDRFNISFLPDSIVLIKADEGARRVAGGAGRPIIDTNNAKILDSLSAAVGDQITVVITSSTIVFTGTQPAMMWAAPACESKPL
jgi:hypothetical protein